MMKRKVKISVVTATFNSESVLETAVQSIIHQTYDNIEYIIVDGKSTDRTLDIVKKYESYIDYFVSESDAGIYNAFNKGISLSTGDVIYFLNSDDYFYNDSVLEKVAAKFNENPLLNFVYGNVLGLEEETDFSYKTGKFMTIQDFKSGQTYPHQGFFAKKELFLKYGNFDETYQIVADLEFMIKCFMDAEQISEYLNEFIAVFRLGGASNHYSSRQFAIDEAEQVLSKYFPTNDCSKKSDINALYRQWLEMLLLRKRGLGWILKQKNINKIAIFGAMKTGRYILEDCNKNEVQVLTFLDNNQSMQGELINGIEINSPYWLVNNNHSIDAVIIAIEGFREKEIIQQILNICPQKKTNIYSWKELF